MSVYLLGEKDLPSYVEYWGGNLDNLSHPIRKRGRSLAAEVFYCLHFPQSMPQQTSWNRTVRQAVTFLRDRLHHELPDVDVLFRTPECKDYFKILLNGFIQVYGEKEVFRFRYQNWYVVDCETMIDELWTVLESTK